MADLLQQTRRLTSVAENLLLLSRADTGRLALRATNFNLRNVLEGSMEDARILGEAKQTSDRGELPESLPDDRRSRHDLVDPAESGRERREI